MKPATNNVALFMSFSLYCLSFLSLVNAEGNNTLIAESCEKTKYKDLCISSLETEHASQDADLPAIAFISIKVASNKGSDTSVYVKKTLDSTKLEPSVEQNFEDCSENYISALQQLDDSVASMVSKGYDDVITWLEGAITDAMSCETGVKQKMGQELELFNKTTEFRQLCSNALDLVNLLDTN
ncbi:hypothetical protein PTKIN_Ptkin15bG0087300 [Pterospermum kingtungense]